MFEWITSPEAWIGLFTLTALEIVLGIDNIIFISILVSRLPKHQHQPGRIIGLTLAMTMRILLLLSLSWLMKLTAPLFIAFEQEISGRDLILLLGGLFLVAKSTHEIHHAVKPEDKDEQKTIKNPSFISVLVQVAILDVVFSLDSVITAVGMANQIEVMILAIVIAVLIMMLSAKSIGDFVERYPTLKMLCLSFLILVGMALVGESLDFHIPKGYIYFAMGFSIVVEMINIKMRKRLISKP